MRRACHALRALRVRYSTEVRLTRWVAAHDASTVGRRLAQTVAAPAQTGTVGMSCPDAVGCPVSRERGSEPEAGANRRKS